MNNAVNIWAPNKNTTALESVVFYHTHEGRDTQQKAGEISRKFSASTDEHKQGAW